MAALSTMEDDALGFQEIMLKVQDSLSEADVLELVFLCTELLRKDLSQVVTARHLFSLLLKDDLLSSEDPSLLIELLTITKHYNLIRQLSLSPQLSKRCVSSYRHMLFELSENISEEDFKNIKFLLHDTLPQKALDKDKTVLQLFLDLEKQGLLDANNLDTVKRIMDSIHPRLQGTIIEFEAKNGTHPTSQETNRKTEIHCQDLSVNIPAQPESAAYAIYKPGSNYSEEGSMAMQQGPTSLSSLPVVSMEGKLASLSLNQSPNQVQYQHMSITSTSEEKKLSSLDPEQLCHSKVGVYDMKGDWRGFCLIINNHNFSKSQISLGNREGTDKDQKSLETVFRWLGFQLVVVRDCSRAEMLSAMKTLGRYNHAQADCVVCCVLSHGFEGGVFGVDGEKVVLRELMEPLTGDQCPALNAKPKLFFIQACQGTEEQPVAFLQSDGPNNCIEMIVCDAQVPRDSIPSGADFLMAMSTVPNFVSYRERQKGTWFMQSLCKKLQQLVPTGTDLLSILTEVNNDVSMRADKTGTKKQIPQPGFTLRKRVVFPIPNVPPLS
ncbi:caspase-8 isoform X2 [Hoplias malabaricus]|uniref:caspase-8 isoform X2 n=1 Tax=Hoplias malabaricus TaxID=27720 RepID=UPI0034637ACD